MAEPVVLDWPYEGAQPPPFSEPPVGRAGTLIVPGSNYVLDLHGDLSDAGLVVFSDGNHHMALEMACRAFLRSNPAVRDIFYATAPPGPLIAALDEGGLSIGNMSFAVKPNVFIGPSDVMKRLENSGRVGSARPFAKSRGVVLLVRKGNKRRIKAVDDLLREDVRLACSNPDTEKASFRVYSESLSALLNGAGGDGETLVRHMKGEVGPGRRPRIAHSTSIHHREIPTLLASDAADVAPVYHHLALRYVRIFPDIFEFVPLAGGENAREDFVPGPEHIITTYHAAVLEDEAGEWGKKFVEFMETDEVRSIYKFHGLEPVAAG